MVLLLLMMMLKRALSLPSSCRCGGISEGRFFHHQVSGGKISLNLRKSDLSSAHASSKKKRSPPLLLRLSGRKRGQRRQRRERKVLSIIDPENEREN